MSEAVSKKDDESKSADEVSAEFSWKTVLDWSKFKKVLVTGMGGGCDVFSAFALAQHIEGLKVLSSDCQLSFGNCTGVRDALLNHKQLHECLYQVECGCDLTAESQYFGTTILEQSLFGRSSLSGPLLSVVLHKRLSDELSTVEAVTKANVSQLCDAWIAAGFDLIIAVDNGGDSVTGGVDFHDCKQLARDMQVAFALDSFQQSATGRSELRRSLHVVYGPCSDGETKQSEMMAALCSEEWKRRLKGSYQLTAEMVEAFSKPCAVLGPKRTPAIIQKAFSLYDADCHIPQTMIVGRGIQPRVDLKLLHSVWVFAAKP